MDGAAGKQIELLPSCPKKLISKSSDETSSTTASSVAMFLFDMYPDPGPLASETSDQMKRFNLFRFLRGKKCSSIKSRKNYRKFHSNGKRSVRYTAC